MELKKVTDDIFYIEDPTNIPIIISNNGVFVVDTGIDKDKGKKIRKNYRRTFLKANLSYPISSPC